MHAEPIRDSTFSERGTVPETLRARWVLIWDRDCGFCRRSVQWILARDRPGLISALPYQQAESWLPAEVWALSPLQAHLRSPEGRYWGGGDAAIRVAGLLGFRGLEWTLSLFPLRPLVHIGYRWVAGHRRLVSRWIARP